MSDAGAHNQIYGFTQIEQPRPGEYVRYLMAFELDNGIEIQVRRPDSTVASIVLTDDEATEFALTLLKSGRCRELVRARLAKEGGGLLP